MEELNNTDQRDTLTHSTHTHYAHRHTHTHRRRAAATQGTLVSSLHSTGRQREEFQSLSVLLVKLPLHLISSPVSAPRDATTAVARQYKRKRERERGRRERWERRVSFVDDAGVVTHCRLLMLKFPSSPLSPPFHLLLAPPPAMSDAILQRLRPFVRLVCSASVAYGAYSVYQQPRLLKT